jgi:hypothetical protein
MLHTGVVIEGKEYAYGGHNKHGVSGVYYTSVGTEPPGGVFRCEILQGFTFRTQKEIKKIVKEVRTHTTQLILRSLTILRPRTNFKGPSGTCSLITATTSQTIFAES